jgi:hypothetical protein
MSIGLLQRKDYYPLVVRYKFIDVSEELTTSIFTVEE